MSVSSSEPDGSRENRLVRHKHSSSEVERRGHIPMYVDFISLAMCQP